MNPPPLPRLSPIAKIGIVLGGFFAALVAAIATVGIQQRLTPASDASGGMQAFGDLLLGLAVFGVLSSLPSALGLYWLWDGFFRRKPTAPPVDGASRS